MRIIKLCNVHAFFALAATMTSCSSAPSSHEPLDDTGEAGWTQSCRAHEIELKNYIGKSVWFNPVGQWDYHQKPNDYPKPFSEEKIIDVSLSCVPTLANEPDYQLGGSSYKDRRYLYSSPPDHQDVTFIVSDGAKKWSFNFNHPDLTLANQFDSFFYQESKPDNSVLLPSDPHLKYPKVRWGLVSDLVKRGKYRLGISSDELILIHGHPTEINTTDVAGGHSEQFVYQGDPSSDYFYFDNGKLTVIQQ